MDRGIARLPVFIRKEADCVVSVAGGCDMPQRLNWKAVANESKYPYIVELLVFDDKLDVEVSRRILDFHRSQKILARYGRRIIRGRHIYFRWCFSDLVTASAFMEQFGGKLTGSGQPERRSR
jgi:hypothetical protein